MKLLSMSFWCGLSRRCLIRRAGDELEFGCGRMGRCGEGMFIFFNTPHVSCWHQSYSYQNVSSKIVWVSSLLDLITWNFWVCKFFHHRLTFHEMFDWLIFSVIGHFSLWQCDEWKFCYYRYYSRNEMSKREKHQHFRFNIISMPFHSIHYWITFDWLWLIDRSQYPSSLSLVTRQYHYLTVFLCGLWVKCDVN